MTVSLFGSFTQGKTQSGTRAFHDNVLFKAFDLPQWFHVFFLFLVAVVSSTFSEFKPYLL